MPLSDEHSEPPSRGNAVLKTVIERVAEDAGEGTLDLPPLHQAVEPEALSTLVESARRQETSLSIRFTYAGQEVTVDQRGTVRITDP